jgi:hypothetical protein
VRALVDDDASIGLRCQQGNFSTSFTKGPLDLARVAGEDRSGLVTICFSVGRGRNCQFLCQYEWPGY